MPDLRVFSEKLILYNTYSRGGLFQCQHLRFLKTVGYKPYVPIDQQKFYDWMHPVKTHAFYRLEERQGFCKTFVPNRKIFPPVHPDNICTQAKGFAKCSEMDIDSLVSTTTITKGYLQAQIPQTKADQSPTLHSLPHSLHRSL